MTKSLRFGILRMSADSNPDLYIWAISEDSTTLAISPNAFNSMREAKESLAYFSDIMELYTLSLIHI